MANDWNTGEVAENQSNKFLTINTIIDRVIRGVSDKLSVDATSGNVALTADQYRRNVYFEVDVASASGRTVTIPDYSSPLQGIRKFAIFGSLETNTVDFDLVHGSASEAMSPGDVFLVYTDTGVNSLIKLAGGSGSSDEVLSYLVSSFIASTPGNSERVLVHVAADSFTLPSGLATSQAIAKTGATGSPAPVFNIQKNGSNIGTITFSSPSTVGVFSLASDTAFAAGDTLEVVAPASADPSLANIAITFKGTRNSGTGTRDAPTVQKFTSNDTWNRPTGCRKVLVEVWGGGGAGGGAEATSAGENSIGGGGGAAGYTRKLIDVTSIASATVTVGSGGTGVSGASGNNGNNSSWSDGTNTLTASGGTGSALNSSTSGFSARGGGDGGSASGGDINMGGQAGDAGIGLQGNLVLGGTGGAPGGGIGARRVGSGEGGEIPASGHGGGGGGAVSLDSGAAAAGGDGGDGLVVVTEFY